MWRVICIQPRRYLETNNLSAETGIVTHHVLVSYLGPFY